MAKPPRSVAAKPPRAPDSLPIGVRAPATMTDPGMTYLRRPGGQFRRRPPRPATTTGAMIRRHPQARPHGPASALCPEPPGQAWSDRAGYSAPMQEFLAAILAGASGDELAAIPLPESYRAAFVRRDEVGDVRRASSPRTRTPQVAPRGRGGRARAGPRRGLRRGHGQLHQLQHRLDLDLRAAADLRLPRPAGQGERVGHAPRPRLPRGRLRRLGRGAAGRLGGPQLEAGRQGHRPLQLRRRPEPERPRRLDAGRQPAHLGVRDQLRRPGRPGGGQGQPADAQAHAT